MNVYLHYADILSHVSLKEKEAKMRKDEATLLIERQMYVLGFTKSSLAASVGIAPEHLGKILSFKVLPNPKTSELLANALQMPIHDLRAMFFDVQKSA